MGDADQFIKRIFRDETAPATHDVARFENAPEIATPSLTPDGILAFVAPPPTDGSLLAPWTLFTARAVADFKMEGDHVDRVALARVELRRHAAWVAHLETGASDADALPARYATIVVAPHLPLWLRTPAACAPLVVTEVAPGCHAIAPRDHPVLWIAANELPLHTSLIPFLWVRSGRPQVDFVRWLAAQRGVARVAAVIRLHPMGAQIASQLTETPAESEVERQRGLEIAKIFLHGFPELAAEIREEATLQPLEHQFSRRLGRPVTAEERATLMQRLRTHGADHIGDAVLDLDRAALERWLAASPTSTG